MPRLLIKISVVKQTLGPLLLYLLACVCLIFAFASGLPWVVPLFVASAAAILWLWYRTPWTDSWSRYMSFGAVLLLMCALNRVFYVADYFITGTQFEGWPFAPQSPRVAVFKAEVIVVAGTMLTVLAWRMCGGMRVSPSVVMAQPGKTRRVVLAIYLMALAGMFISERMPSFAALSGQLLPTLLALGLVSTYLLPMSAYRRDSTRLIAAVLLSIPFFALAAGSGSKQSIILAVVPGGVMAWRYFRHPLLRGGMIAVGLTALALITAYVNLYRTEVWMPANRGAPISQTVPQDFVDEVKANGLLYTVGEGLSAFINRSDESYQHGWAISIADEQEYHPQLVLAPLAYVMVPRMVWPGKPLIQTGWEYSGVVFGERYISWSRSSTAAGFYPALYLGFGWPALVLGALLAGAMLAAMTRLALRWGGELAAGLYIFSLLPFMLRMGATWPDGALSTPIISLVYVLIIVTLARLVARVAIKTSRVPATRR